jgi:hypothetical protein
MDVIMAPARGWLKMLSPPGSRLIVISWAMQAFQEAMPGNYPGEEAA